MASRKSEPDAAKGNARNQAASMAELGNLATSATALLAGAVSGAIASNVNARETVATHHMLPENTSGQAAASQPATDHDENPSPVEKASLQHAGDEAGAPPDDQAHVATVDDVVDRTSDHPGYDASISPSVSGSGPRAEIQVSAANHPQETQDAAAQTNSSSAAGADHVAPEPPLPGLIAASATPDANSTEQTGVRDLVGPIVAQADTSLHDLVGRLSDAVDALQTQHKDFADRVTKSVDALTDKIEAGLGQSAAALSEITSSLAGKVDTILADAIPDTLLGAVGKGDGLLETLFDTGSDVPNSLHDTFEVTDTATTILHDVTATVEDSIVLPELGTTVEAVTIGFTGQSYVDLTEALDIGHGNHGNLLHGLL